MKKNGIGLLLIMTLFSCATMTKESYLNDFQTFVNEVRDHKSAYTENDWRKADEKYKNYTVALYEKFEKDMFIDEKLTITRYKASYNVYRYTEKSKDTLSDIFGSTLEVTEDAKNALRDRVEYYMENDMQEDLDNLIEQSKRVGGKINEALNDVLNELQIK